MYVALTQTNGPNFGLLFLTLLWMLDSSRLRSREFHYGSIQLCEVIYSCIVQGRDRLKSSLSSSTSSDPSAPPSATSSPSISAQISTNSTSSPKIPIHRASRHASVGRPANSLDADAYWSEESPDSKKTRKHIRSSSGIVLGPTPKNLASKDAVPKIRTSSKRFLSLNTEDTAAVVKDALLKKAMLELLFLWADSMVRKGRKTAWLLFFDLMIFPLQIQFAASKKSDSLCESLFSTAADKFMEAVTLDASSLPDIFLRISSFEEQAKENRRFHYAIAQMCRALAGVQEYDLNGTGSTLVKWALSLLSYAKLHQEDPVKHASLHKEAGAVIERALKADSEYFDAVLSQVFQKQGNELAFYLRVMIDTPTLFTRAGRHGAAIARVDISGCASVTDYMLITLMDLCPFIDSLNMSSCKRVTDVALEYIAPRQARTLRRLNVASCDALTDAGMVKLCSKATLLEELYLAGCSNLTDETLSAAFNCLPNLRVLDLEKSRVQARVDPSRLPEKLASLNLSHCKLEDPALVHIVRGSTAMTELRLNGCSMISDIALIKVSTMAPHLKILQIHSMYRVSDSAIAAIVGFAPSAISQFSPLV